MRIAITGGIGSGKSYVCGLLRERGIMVYDCDAAAKHLMATDTDLQKALQQLVGTGVYQGHVLQKPVLAKFLLASEEHKRMVNEVVHPAVARHFIQSGYEWLESAILFESGFYRRVHFDYVVCVAAPVEVRLARVMARDHISRQKAMDWIDSQMDQDKVMSRSDFIVINDGQKDLQAQVDELLRKIKSHNKK